MAGNVVFRPLSPRHRRKHQVSVTRFVTDWRHNPFAKNPCVGYQGAAENIGPRNLGALLAWREEASADVVDGGQLPDGQGTSPGAELLLPP